MLSYLCAHNHLPFLKLSSGGSDYSPTWGFIFPTIVAIDNDPHVVVKLILGPLAMQKTSQTSTTSF